MSNEVLEYISWIFVALALVGSFFNSQLNQAKAFRIWFISNLFFVLFNLYFGHYGVATLYGCHWLLTIIGLYNIKKRSKI